VKNWLTKSNAEQKYLKYQILHFSVSRECDYSELLVESFDKSQKLTSTILLFCLVLKSSFCRLLERSFHIKNCPWMLRPSLIICLTFYMFYTFFDILYGLSPQYFENKPDISVSVDGCVSTAILKQALRIWYGKLDWRFLNIALI